MAHRVIVLPSAERDLERLSREFRQRTLRRFVWLAENAHQVAHHRLVNMPADLAGLCRFRVGDYRILYWYDWDQSLLTVYRVQHRSEVYRDF